MCFERSRHADAHFIVPHENVSEDRRRTLRRPQPDCLEQCGFAGVIATHDQIDAADALDIKVTQRAETFHEQLVSDR